MKNDYIIHTIIEGITKDIKDKDFVDLDVEVKREIINLIKNTQSKSIIIGIENKEDIRLPYLGSIKIKSGRKFAVTEHSKLLDKYNVDNFDELSEERKKAFIEEHRDIIRKEFLKRKIKNKADNPFGKNTVLTKNIRQFIKK